MHTPFLYIGKSSRNTVVSHPDEKSECIVSLLLSCAVFSNVVLIE